MFRNKLFFIGTSKRHVPFIRIAQRMGCFVVGIDKDINSPGAKLCHVFKPISIKDTDSALQLASHYDVDACVTVADQGLGTCAAINTKLSLRGIKNDTYDIVNRKDKFKDVMKFFGVPTPKVTYDEFPVIVKPKIGTGSNGVVKLNTKHELGHYMYSAKNDNYIVEKFIEGDHLSVDILMQGGITKYSLMQDRYLEHDDCYVDSIIVSPSKYFKVSPWENGRTDILHTAELVCMAIGLMDGPANVQFIIDKDGNEYVHEVNPKISGPYGIECHTYATNTSWFRDILKVALGIGADSLDYNNIVPNACITFGADKDGLYYRTRLSSAARPIIDEWWWKETGDTIHKFKTVKDSIGHIFIMGDDVPEITKRARIILEETKIQYIGGC